MSLIDLEKLKEFVLVPRGIHEATVDDVLSIEENGLKTLVVNIRLEKLGIGFSKSFALNGPKPKLRQALMLCMACLPHIEDPKHFKKVHPVALFKKRIQVEVDYLKNDEGKEIMYFKNYYRGVK